MTVRAAPVTTPYNVNSSGPGGGSETSAEPLPTSDSSGTVAIATDAQSSDQAQPIADFLNQYFTAINNRDYSSYAALLGSNAMVSESQFAKGYESTQDSNETLVNISTDSSSGDYVAEVTFTSDQNAGDSPDQATCNNWDINLYLTPDGNGSYLIDQPAPGYKASYSNC